MANNPKLEIFKIKLKTKKENNRTSICFHNFLNEKLNLKATDSNELIKEFYSLFFKELDTEKFHLNKKTNKGITASNDLIKYWKIRSNDFIIEGTIDGGAYGKERGVSQVSNKKVKSKLKKDQIVFDTYYFFLKLPMDHHTGILMVQSFTEDSVNEAFKDFIKKLFTTEGYFNPDIKPFIPKKIKEDFNQFSYVNKISYATPFFVPYLQDEATENEADEYFKIKIDFIKADGSKLNHKIADRIIKGISSNFKISNNKVEKSLDSFTKKTIYLTNEETKKDVHYDLGNEFQIKPNIYLANYIDVDPSSGEFSFQELSSFCNELIINIMDEVIPKINE